MENRNILLIKNLFSKLMKVLWKLIVWICFTIILSILPLIVSIALLYSHNIELQNIHFFTELFLFCAMFAVTLMKDFYEVEKTGNILIQFALILVIVICSALYGSLFVDEYIGTVMDESAVVFLKRVLMVCVSFELIVGVLIQIYGALKNE